MRKIITSGGTSRREHFKSGFFIFLMFLTALTLPVALKGQYGDIKFDRVSIGEGLYQGTISCIDQDKKGFMWFGTQHGLHRYDGYTCKMYESNPRKPNSLSYNLVNSICEGDSDYFWIGTRGGGLNKFDPKKEEFTEFKKTPGNPYSLSNNNVTKVINDGSGTLWIGTYQGLNRFDTKEKKFFHIEDLKDSRINAMCLDSSDILWVGTDAGIYRSTDKDKNNFKRFDVTQGIKRIGDKKINAIMEEKPGVLWFGTDDGVFRFTLESGKNIHDMKTADKLKKKDFNKPVTAFFKDNSGVVWIGTDGDGLYIFNSNSMEFNHYRYEENNLDSLSSNRVLSFFQDRSGIIWIGTGGGGFNTFDPFRLKFKLYKNNPKNNNSLSNNEVRGICEGQDGIIWVGTADGVNHFDPGAKEFIHYKISEKVRRNSNRNIISAVFEDHAGVLWVGTKRAGFFTLKKEQKDIEPYTDKHIKKDAYILTIYEDGEDILWVGTEDKGLIKISADRDKTKTEKIEHDPQKKNSISDNRIFAIIEDKIDKNILWIGTGGGGLNKLDKTTGEFDRYRPKQDDLDSLSHNIVASLLVDNKGTLWVGTGGRGLNKFDRESGTFEVYTTDDGLPDNVIYAILEDSDGNLWLSTNKGLSRFDPDKDKGEFRNYTIRDGLQSYEFNRGAAFESKVGKMYFGGFNGFNLFDPKTVKQNERKTPPPIVITTLKKNKEVQQKKSTSEKDELNLAYNDELDLSYKDKSVSFEFAALSFADPGSNQYAYKLEKVDNDWIKLGNKHNIDLINLKPGNYKLRVKGSNNDGAWNERGTSLNIRVTPPFTQTWYFYILIVLSISSIIYGLFKWRINIIEKANEELKKAEELYRTLVETSPDAITLSDVDTKEIIMANQKTATLLGYRNDEELKKNVKNIFDAFAPHDRSRAEKNAKQIIESGFNRSSEYALVSKDEAFIDVEMSTTVIRDAEQKPQYFLSITRDIRARKAEQDRLAHIDKMVALGSLVSGVAHELNNPLSSIKYNSEIFSKIWKDVAPVLDTYYQEDEDFEMANIPYEKAKTKLDDLIIGLMESSERIEKIITDLRNFARPGDPITRELIDVNEVLNSSTNLNNNMIKKATQHFSVNLATDLPQFKGNFQKLEQVFINLIQNACQSLQDTSKKIEISTIYDKNTNRIVIKFKDEGAGIDEENLKKITDPFFTTKRDTGGIGLGLSISMRIIKEHGGRMDFDSKVGMGTTVSVYLPVE